MVFISFCFAPMLFKQLPMEQARPALRGTFPYFYGMVILLSGVTGLLALTQSTLATVLAGIICAPTLCVRQVLMGKVNAAVDCGGQKGFRRLHMVSVVIQVIQIGLCGWAVLPL